eukprot:811614-Prymnesium_polylepis.1
MPAIARFHEPPQRVYTTRLADAPRAQAPTSLPPRGTPLCASHSDQCAMLLCSRQQLAIVRGQAGRLQGVGEGHLAGICR